MRCQGLFPKYPFFAIYPVFSSNMAVSGAFGDTELRRKNSALTQQWLETLASLQNHQMNQTQNRPSVPNIYATQQSLIKRQKKFLRDCSFQSDDSHCSSVESVLELRRPDPEEVLLGLGFGPRRNSSTVGRIPARFLQPSKLITDIDINKFLEQYGQNYSDLPQSAPPSPAKIRPKSH